MGGLQRDPGGWEGLFLHPEGCSGMGEDVPASHSLIPHPNTRNGPGNPGFDLPNLCGTQISRDGCLFPFMLFQMEGSRIPRASHSPISSFPSPVWISHPLEQLITFAGEGQALGVALWSVQQPQEISHPERCPQPQSS